LGVNTIDREFVADVIREDQAAPAQAVPQVATQLEMPKVIPVRKEARKERLWKNRASLGYTFVGGNTDREQGSIVLESNRKTKSKHTRLKFEAFTAEQNGSRTEEQYYGLASHDVRVNAASRWYTTYQIEAEKNRFRNLDYRVTPGIGIGYWWIDKPNLQLKTEGLLAYEMVKYKNGSRAENTILLVPSLYYKKEFGNGITISEDLKFYPSLEDLDQYRFRSETAFRQPIRENLSWKISLIEDYNSLPAEGDDKLDYRLVTGLEYEF
jgi:putative salt-induced outer membrane protein YdiY